MFEVSSQRSVSLPVPILVVALKSVAGKTVVAGTSARFHKAF